MLNSTFLKTTWTIGLRDLRREKKFELFIGYKIDKLKSNYLFDY